MTLPAALVSERGGPGIDVPDLVVILTTHRTPAETAQDIMDALATRTPNTRALQGS